MRARMMFFLLMLSGVSFLLASCRSSAAARISDDAIRKKLDAIAAAIDRDIQAALDSNRAFAEEATEIFNQPWPNRRIDSRVYTKDRYGILSDHGRMMDSNVYVDRNTHIDAHTRGFILVTEQLEGPWKKIRADNPNIGWQFITETKYDSMRIFPWAETTYSYGPDVDWKQYNFYRCAIPSNNPDRKQCAGSIGMDMLGLGLITSISTPIYRGDQFAGIASTDLLVTKSLRKYLREDLLEPDNYLMLIHNDSRVILRDERESGERRWDEMFSYNALSNYAKNNEGVHALLEQVRANESGAVDISVPEPKRVFFKKLKTVGWIPMIVATRHDER